MIIAFGVVTTVIVCIRLLFKQYFSTKQRLGIDDWTVLLATTPIGIPTIATAAFGLTAHGLGKDIWGLQPSGLVAFGLYFYIIQILYILIMTLIKLTLSLFYLDIFPGRIIRRLLWGTVAFHIAYGVAFGVGIIFWCSPISYQWTQYDFTNGPQAQGHCIDINAAGWASAAIGVASDIWLLAIPLSQVKKLKLHWKKKIGAAVMFMTGAL